MTVCGAASTTRRSVDPDPLHVASMAVDVVTEVEIACPRDQVAGVRRDPDHAIAWTRTSRRSSGRPTGRWRWARRVAFVARFLGRRLSYTYAVRQLVAASALVMSTADGPFPMETTYTWTDVESAARR